MRRCLAGKWRALPPARFPILFVPPFFSFFQFLGIHFGGPGMPPFFFLKHLFPFNASLFRLLLVSQFHNTPFISFCFRFSVSLFVFFLLPCRCVSRRSLQRSPFLALCPPKISIAGGVAGALSCESLGGKCSGKGPPLAALSGLLSGLRLSLISSS